MLKSVERVAVPCGAIYCLWAKCERIESANCPRRKWAENEYRATKGVEAQSQTGVER